MLHAGESRLGGLEEAVPRHKGNRLGVRQEIGDLVGTEQHIERYHRVSGVVAPEVGDGEVGHVREEDRDVLARFHAERPQGSGEALDEAVDRFVGEIRVPDRQRRFLRVVRGALPEQQCKIEAHGCPP